MEYATLDFSRFETRFLRLVELDPLRFEVETAALSKPPDYFALSYCWGDSSSKAEIEISRKNVEISKNLEEALRHSGLNVGERIWADAICINQSDLYEKSYQVNMMGQIYTKAKKVIAWLGVESGQSSSAAKLVRKLSSFARRSELTFDDPGNPGLMRVFLDCVRNIESPTKSLRGLVELLCRPYWERAWIIQEIAKARKIEMRCGKLRMGLKELLYIGHRHVQLPERNRALLTAISEFRKQEQLETQRMSLLQALLVSRFSLATDERDKVYAMLGLAMDGVDLVPTPTYGDSVPEVFEQLTKRILQSRQPGNVALLAKRAPLSRRFPESSPWTVDWAELALSIPQWLTSSANTVLKYSKRNPAVRKSMLHTRGHLLGDITSIEVAAKHRRWASDHSLGDGRYSYTVMKRISSNLLERLVTRDSTVAVLDQKVMTYALARMIRDADHGLSGPEYGLARINLTLRRLAGLFIEGVPLWQWARQVNSLWDSEQPQDRYIVQRPDIPRSNTSLNNREQVFETQNGTLRQEALLGGEQEPTSASRSIHGSANTSSIDRDTDANTGSPQKVPVSLPTLVAFKLWEDILASFSNLSEDHLQFAITEEKYLVIVPRNALLFDGIYCLSHCTLPVVLREHKQGDHYLIGEAYVGRQSQGEWLSGIDTSFLEVGSDDWRSDIITYSFDVGSDSKSTDSAMRITLASRASDYNHDSYDESDSDFSIPSRRITSRMRKLSISDSESDC